MEQVGCRVHPNAVVLFVGSMTVLFVLFRSTREGSDNDSMSARHHESDVPAAWGSLHENAVYSEERRMTHSTRGSCASLADELPDDFQVVDTASRLFGLPTDKGAVAGELAGTLLNSESYHVTSCCELQQPCLLAAHE